MWRSLWTRASARNTLRLFLWENLGRQSVGRELGIQLAGLDRGKLFGRRGAWGLFPRIQVLSLGFREWNVAVQGVISEGIFERG